jgi:hypothetical protein
MSVITPEQAPIRLLALERQNPLIVLIACPGHEPHPDRPVGRGWIGRGAERSLSRIPETFAARGSVERPLACSFLCF